MITDGKGRMMIRKQFRVKEEITKLSYHILWAWNQIEFDLLEQTQNGGEYSSSDDDGEQEGDVDLDVISSSFFLAFPSFLWRQQRETQKRKGQWN